MDLEVARDLQESGTRFADADRRLIEARSDEQVVAAAKEYVEARVEHQANIKVAES